MDIKKHKRISSSSSSRRQAPSVAAPRAVGLIQDAGLMRRCTGAPLVAASHRVVVLPQPSNPTCLRQPSPCRSPPAAPPPPCGLAIGGAANSASSRRPPPATRRLRAQRSAVGAMPQRTFGRARRSDAASIVPVPNAPNGRMREAEGEIMSWRRLAVSGGA